MERAIALMTCEAARIANLGAGTLSEGGAADIAIFDADAEWVVQDDAFASRSKNSPFVGRTLRGQVKYTFCDGQIVFRDQA